MTDIDQNGLEAAVRECARITAPEVTDEEFERERVEGSSRYLKTREEMSRAIRAYLSAQQREPVVRVKELVWEDADEGMCTKWRACALGGHYELVALDGDGGGLAVNFHWGRPLSFWFIQGEPDELGPTGPKMFPTLDAAKSAAQADYEQRIMAAIEITSSDGEGSNTKQLPMASRLVPPVPSEAIADVSVDELEAFIGSLEPDSMAVARALLARYRIGRR